MFIKLLLLATVAVTAIQGAPILDQSLLHTLAKSGSANIVLTLSHSTTTQILNTIRSHTKNYATRGERLEAVKGALQKATAHSQASILQFLHQQKPVGAIVTPFWITNKIVVRGADVHLLQKLLTRSDLVEIRQEHILPLEKFTVIPAPENEKSNEEWNIQLVRAPPVWATENRGQGAVIANIDTGVRVTHQALPNHRADHGWFDPEGASATPEDSNGHGTYTLAIAAGSMKVGVAPGAQWVACKGCGAVSCTEAALLACGQWVACPTDAQGQNANCSLAPNVVSNSWGGGTDQTFYDDVIQTWRTQGIVPVFGVGNSGASSCSTVGYPGSSPYAIAVGGTTQDEISAESSGTGPTTDGRIKPDLAAPSMTVRSAYGTADDAYMVLSGTSAAIPHVAGVAALILTENPDLTVDQVQAALQVGALPTEPTGRNCGDVDESTYPNNHVGYGRVDALNSVASVVGGK